MELKDKKIAMLIDGDNAQAKLLPNIIEETAKYGRVTIKRIYGDWTSPGLKGWKDQLNTHSVKPIQKFAHAKGKNATDIALIIDAMDILHLGEVDGFCLVSSDSDFAGLAHRIRESGSFVIGIGMKQTPKPFINSCDIFLITENFESTINSQDKNKKAIDIKFIRKAFVMVEDENGNALLSRLSDSIRKLDSSFDPRSFGFKNYLNIFKSLKKDFKVVYHKDNSTISIKDLTS